MNIEEFLKDCVYYPCSGLDGFPVKFLSQRFQRFFYVDASTSREDFERRAIEPGFDGYDIDYIEELSAMTVFGAPWEDIEQEWEQTFSRLTLPWSEPFLLMYTFRRREGLGATHGPESFQLLFARCEAIAAFKLAFARRNLAPKCLVHIQPGVSFGGNFLEYAEELSIEARNNRGGLPACLFYDRRGGDNDWGSYLNLVEEYEPVEQVDYPEKGPLTLACR